mmetsp:Transcript_1574/g.4097  ORF Transcript_1574/g.4097 Transcript_1574/m.4097 type:complete len:298 (+) Transcript_1574:708-1601(+)
MQGHLDKVRPVHDPLGAHPEQGAADDRGAGGGTDRHPPPIRHHGSQGPGHRQDRAVRNGRSPRRPDRPRHHVQVQLPKFAHPLQRGRARGGQRARAVEGHCASAVLDPRCGRARRGCGGRGHHDRPGLRAVRVVVAAAATRPLLRALYARRRRASPADPRGRRRQQGHLPLGAAAGSASDAAKASGWAFAARRGGCCRRRRRRRRRLPSPPCRRGRRRGRCCAPRQERWGRRRAATVAADAGGGHGVHGRRAASGVCQGGCRRGGALAHGLGAHHVRGRGGRQGCAQDVGDGVVDRA